MAGYGKVTAPRKWKSSPDHPQAQLAYVTQDEIDMLVDANIYGSMDGKPNRGPKGIISLQGDIGGYRTPSSSRSSRSSGPSRPPGQPSTGPHIGYGGGQPTQVTTPKVTTPGDTGDITSDLDDLLAATNAGNINNNIGITTLDDGTISVPELTTSSTAPEDWEFNEDIWDLAVQASTNPGYELSYEGQGLMNEGIMPGSAEWVTHFGLPNIILTGQQGAITTGIGGESYTDEYGQTIEGGNPIMTGLGQTLLDQYDNPTGSYQEMADDYWAMVQASQDSSGPSVPEQQEQQGYGERRPSLAEFARNFWFSESLGDVEAKEAQREAEGLGVATMSDMDRMYAKDFSAEAMGPNPFFDPEFSYGYYEDYDPIYAGMDLFQRARS